MSALPSPLNLDWDDLGDRTHVLLPDRLTDQSVLEAFNEQILWLIDVLSRRCLTLHFNRVPYITSGPVRVLLALRKRLNELDGELVLRNLSPACQEVLDVTKVLTLFTIAQDCPVSPPLLSAEEAAFRRAVAESPEDLAPRLMYADWLQERGDPLGELIRVQSLLEDTDPDDPRRPALIAQESALLGQHKRLWLGRPGRYINDAIFRCGFPEVVVLDAVSFLEHAEDLVSQFPVRHLKLLGAARVIDALSRCEHLRRLTDLQFNSNYLNDGAIELLVRSRYLERLRGLHLSHNRIGDPGGRAIANASALTGLTVLDLSHNLLGDLAVTALAGSPYLGRLTTLKLHHNRVGTAGARALIDSPHLRRLTMLDLTDPPTGRGAHFADEHNTILLPEQRALRKRFGDDACRF